MSITITPLKPEIGVEITGRSGSEFGDPEAAKECEAALEEHGVVVYREANIDDDDLIAFSHLLGPVHIWPNNDEQKRELGIVSLDPAVAKNAAVQRGTFNWHIDGTMADVPHRLTLLSCIAPPNDGSGDTEFANTYAAYDALPEDDKSQIDDLQVHYSYLNRTHLQHPHVTDETVAAYEKYPPRDRPLVWKHRTGRKSMLLGSTASEVIGWPDERGRDLLDRLLEWSTQPRFTVRHHWTRGDLVVWDNSGVLHRAHPYEPESGRLLHRTTIDGDETVS